MKASLELAQTTVRDELAHVRTEVKNRIDDEFRTAHITALVADAAKERTGAEILGVLHSEVVKAIDEQKPTIETAVIDQTKVAVSVLEPEIRSTIAKVTRDEIGASVKPIKDEMQSYGYFILLGKYGHFSAKRRSTSFRIFDGHCIRKKT